MEEKNPLNIAVDPYCSTFITWFLQNEERNMSIFTDFFL